MSEYTSNILQGLVGKRGHLVLATGGNYIGTVTAVMYDVATGEDWLMLDSGWSVKYDNIVAAKWSKSEEG